MGPLDATTVDKMNNVGEISDLPAGRCELRADPETRIRPSSSSLEPETLDFGLELDHPVFGHATTGVETAANISAAWGNPRFGTPLSGPDAPLERTFCQWSLTFGRSQEA